MDFKETLLMPKTDFEMKGNLPKKEPEFLKQWLEMDLYHELLKMNEGNTPFVLHDGPPYANNNLHAGTAMNRILKDMIIKSKAKNGFYTPFFPGWDTHGLPIENAIQKLGHNRKEYLPSAFRSLCYDYALTQVELQRNTMKRLGALADYDHPYITLTKDFEARQIKTFAKMALKGLIFQGLKPVYWSYASESAIADSEIVYYDKKDPTIFVAFQVKDGKGILTSDDSFVIWTTTPWTIPANLGICLNPRLTYALVKTEKGNLIFLEKMVEDLCAKFEITEHEILKTFKGSELEYITTTHPLYPQRESLVIVGEHVTDSDGTGCVHTAPGHGADDFYVGQKYGLQAFCPVDEKGCMTIEAGEFLVGKHVDDANKIVTTKLDELGNLLKLEFVTHSYPHDERMKKPVIYRATVQWFASIDKIREDLLKEIKNVKWENDWGEARLYNMIKDRGDWCISRQRLWGLPIPIIYTENHQPIIDEKVFDHIADLIAENGSNIWFELEAKDLLPEGYTHKDSPNGIFTKETDIMDVWFDSGSSSNELQARGLDYPADLYFEGSDQYRGWFNSSLCIGVATNNQAPYKSVLSHGYVCDSKGFKMSKSVGNIVSPIDIMEKNGADVLRLWCGSIDYKQDVRMDKELRQVSEAYRKIRNTFRFMLGNLNPEDFDYNKDLIAYENLELVDQYMMIKLNKLNDEVIKDYNKYDFLSANNKLLNFLTVNLSAFYLDFTKDILYIDKKDALRRRQVQSVLYHCVDTLARLYSITLSYTMEEVWQYFKHEDIKSIHLAKFNEVKEYANENELSTKLSRFMLIKDDVYKALEEARADKTIGKSLEAKVLMNASEEDQALLNELFANIKQVFIVSDFEFTSEQLNQYEVVQVKVEKALGEVCPRCWNVTNSDHEDHLCDRCQKVLG
ncbi:MAG: isoleucine--tRNA ligase [Erysipelotrichaceae bacterium]